MPGLRFETTPAEARNIEKAVIGKLMAYARTAGISDPIVRDILPNEDLKGGGIVESGNLWQQDLSQLQYVTVYSGTNDDDRAFAIFSVANMREDPLTLAVRFWDGTGRTALKDIWQVEHVWLNEDCEAYVEPDAVIFYGVSKGYNVDFFGRVMGKVMTDRVILGGKVVEPRGKTISPLPQWR